MMTQFNPVLLMQAIHGAVGGDGGSELSMAPLVSSVPSLSHAVVAGEWVD